MNIFLKYRKYIILLKNKRKKARMSNRFKTLNNSTESTIKNQKNENQNRQNIFKQKPTYSGNQPKKQYKRQTENQFRKKSIKPLNFKLEDENFPSLSSKTQNTNNSELSYLEKIKQCEEEKELQEDNVLPKGYIKLTHESLAKIAAMPKIPKEPINEYYNPYNAYLIMENRRIHREELNDILGDISPYWDIPTTIDDDEDDNAIDIYSEEEEEYVEDW